MFIRLVDESLERHLRTAVPFPASAGDVSFAVPTRAWSETLTRPTFNLFLFDITRSAVPNRAAVRRVDGNGLGERRPPQPMIELNYMVSAWAEDPLREHELLGAVISSVAGLAVLPAEVVSPELSSSVHLSFVEDDRHRARDIWNGAGNALRAGFSMHVTAAADTFGWAPMPTPISGITADTRRGTARERVDETP